LHIHSCLSPCADNEMTPANIANMARLAGLQALAVSDHNSCINCPAVAAAAERAGLLAIPAMELCTSEEVHILCLLPDLASAAAFSGYVRQRLPGEKNNPSVFGRQLVMDDEDTVLGEEDALLIGACGVGIYEVSGLVKSFGGIAVPAHIDRASFSLLSNLGFYDSAMDFPVMEISPACDEAALRRAHPELDGCRLISSSDAHSLVGMLPLTRTLTTEELTVRSILRSLSSPDG